jgi:hypothetical protein
MGLHSHSIDFLINKYITFLKQHCLYLVAIFTQMTLLSLVLQYMKTIIMIIYLKNIMKNKIR